MEKFHPIEKNNKTLRMYLVFWIGQMLSMFGSSIVQFAAMWWITVETEDPLYMTVLMLAFMIPRIVLGAFGGVWADKYNKKLMIFFVDAFQAAVTLFMILFSSLWIESVWVFILFISVRHIGQGIQQPAVSTIAPMLVPDEHLSRMNGLASLFNTLLQLGSPFLGAFLTTQWSLSQIMWIDVISFIAASIPLFFMTLPVLVPIMEEVKSNEKQKSSFK
ncbi:MAG: MFS transporter, partial [Candidatus Heimdallarchaeota archaeon]|nr:MFS transporter [Candidatus Heimdallarchaeota archaeon]